MRFVKIFCAFLTLLALASPATVLGKPLKLDPDNASVSGNVRVGGDGHLGMWRKGGSASWKLKKAKPGKYNVSLSYAVDPTGGGITSLLIDGKKVGRFAVSDTGSWKKFKVITVGPIEITDDMKELTITGVPSSRYLMNLKQVRLVKL